MPLSFNRHLQKSRTQHGGTEYCAMNVWSLAFILNDDHITPWGPDTYFPILIYQHHLWFSLRCCHSPAVLTNALSTASLEFTQHHKSSWCPKAKEKRIHFHLHFIWTCNDSWYNKTLQLFKLCIIHYVSHYLVIYFHELFQEQRAF